MSTRAHLLVGVANGVVLLIAGAEVPSWRWLLACALVSAVSVAAQDHAVEKERERLRGLVDQVAERVERWTP